MLNNIKKTIASGKPFLLAGKLGTTYHPTLAEQQAGQFSGMSMPYICTMGLPMLLGPGFPELVVWAWEPWRELITATLLSCVDKKPSSPWPMNEPIPDFFDIGKPGRLSPIHPSNYDGFVDSVLLWYESQNLDAPEFALLLLPDKNGKFPGDPGVHEIAGWSQPLLDKPWKN